jgi:5-oxoprolinase (ATP-hydrolysing)
VYLAERVSHWIHIDTDLTALEPELRALKDRGIDSVALCFLHSYTYPAHEQAVADLCKTLGFRHVTLSSQIMPMIKLIPRGNSAVADAFLTPCLQKYLEGFYEGFDDGISQVQIEFMQSDGGLAPVRDFTGFRAILSGPAGGVVGYAKTSWDKTRGAVIGFDMGGTSTDVSRFDGRFEQVFETTTAGVTIQAPQLDIQTVAAGGGSRLFFRNGLFVTGPDSVGADPGPTCYRKGGDLAITDANCNTLWPLF